MYKIKKQLCEYCIYYMHKCTVFILFAEGGSGNPLQYSCLKNSMDRGAWWVAVQSITKNLTEQLSTHTI